MSHYWTATCLSFGPPYAAGYTQEKLAELANISADYVQSIERGSRLPNVAIADDLRRALGAKWEDLLGK